jgi:hypothetical protein
MTETTDVINQLRVLAKPGRPFRAQYTGKDAITGLPILPGEEVYKTDLGYIRNETLLQIKICDLGEEHSYHPYGEFDVDKVWATLQKGYEVTLYNQHGHKRVWHLHKNGEVRRKGKFNDVSFNQFKSQTRAMTFMVCTGFKRKVKL